MNRLHHAAAVVAAALLLSGSEAAGQESSPAPGQVCPAEGYRWSPPIIAPGWSTQQPYLALGDGIAYAFGTRPQPAQTAAPSLRSPSSILALRGTAERLGTPPGAIDFFDPVMAVDGVGTLHVMWGEHADPGSRSGGPGEQRRLGRVLHARYQGGRWSQAQVVYQAPAIHWMWGSVSRLEADPTGRLHVVLPVVQPQPDALVYLRLGPDGWRAHDWRIDPSRPPNRAVGAGPYVPAGSGFYPALAVGSGGRLYLTSITAARAASGERIPGGDTNSVWVRRSDDGGRTWGAPVLVNRSGRQQAHRPQIVAVGRDTVHVLWEKDLDASPGPEAIWHAISVDGGVTWGRPAEIRPPGRYPFRNLRAAARPNGEVLIAFATRPAASDTPTEQIFYSRWRGAGWSPPMPLRPELEVRAFDLAVDRAGRLHLLWSSFVKASEGQTSQRPLKFAVGSPCRP